MLDFEKLLQKIKHHKKELAILGALLFYFSLFFFQYILLHTADIGRFITNGREIFAGHFWQVVTTNYYSYTHPDYPFINHHWFYGVIAYIVHQVGGFSALTLFNASVATTAFGLMVWWSFRKHGLWPAVIAGLVGLPLIVSREEVRPETVSLLGFALYFVILESYVNKKLSTKWLWISLLSIQLVWQNTHLFFVLGLLQVFIFWLYAIFTKNTTAIQQLGALGVASGLLTILNPNGLRGALMPFNIFKKYGYSVAENQTLLFILERFKKPLQYFEVVLVPISVLGNIGAFSVSPKKNRPLLLVLATLVTIFTIAAFKITRLESFWGIMLIPFVATVVAAFQQKYQTRISQLFSGTAGTMISTTLGFIVLIAVFKTGLYTPFPQWFGIGTYPGTNGAAQFIKDRKIPGPIFNNYDIGGYLIYYLYPDYQVYVDNRPETYPVDFFSEEYIKPQEDPDTWREIAQKYDINMVVFYRHDLTNWGQAMLIFLVEDEDWIPIFVDRFSIIFVRNDPKNADLIELFALPDDMFHIYKN